MGKYGQHFMVEEEFSKLILKMVYITVYDWFIKILIFNCFLGKVENVIEIPAIQSSSVFFGGQNYDELYVTTGNGSIPENEKSKHPNAGKVFRVTSDKHILLGAGSGRRFKPTQSFHF